MKEQISKYFKDIEEKVELSYQTASKARRKSLDPEDDVGIPLAKNLAERVEGLIGAVKPEIISSGLSKRIQELESRFGKLDFKVALSISLEIAKEKFCKFDSKIRAMETGIRVGLAYLTLGVVASPLEGFVELRVPKRRDGREYFCLMYSGPIRSAGGTAGALSVVIADCVRKEMGYEPYDPSEEEVKRMVTELYDYHERVTNLQYLPSEEEIEFLVKHIPVQISGDSSERREVSNHKDLERIETNNIRSGPCLVIGECMAQKSSKVWKIISKGANEDFGLENWSFLEKFLLLQKKAKSGEGGDKGRILPVYTYIKDLVAGRPVLTHPLSPGGFRLRCGRSRISGYSSTSIHPSTMHVLNQYLATGTQLKMERPGKATALTVCDSIEGPIVKLKDDRVVKLDNEVSAKKLIPDIKEILFLGDILVNYGDFYNRAHPLVPLGYCEEWWALEVEHATVDTFGTLDFEKLSSHVGLDAEFLEELLEKPLNKQISAEDAFKISRSLKVSLHPAFTYHWNLVSADEFLHVLKCVTQRDVEVVKEPHSKLVIPFDDDLKYAFDKIGLPHLVTSKEFLVVEKDDAYTLIQIFNLDSSRKDIEEASPESSTDALQLVNQVSEVKLRDKSGVFIGARMGRPEKAKMRKLTGSPHTLFPVGDEGGRLRSLQSALEKGRITADFRVYYCSKCNKSRIFKVCDECGSKTIGRFYCRECGVIAKGECRHGKANTFFEREINIKDLFSKYLKSIGERTYPDLIKGVRGTSNKDHIPEHFAKGIFRAKYDVCVNKDGTTRYDMTQLPITHFKPKEINTSVDKLKELGYSKDMNGKELLDENQIVELYPQDLILPACEESPEWGCDRVLMNTASFIDDMLQNLYREKPFYNFKSYKDISGVLVAVLAPHTSAAVVGRVIGFSKTQGFFAHPVFHAATRRDCDGDEASVSLLMDVLLNFSKQFLPDTRGATQDAPLVLTSKLIPAEVDDMVFDLDVVERYPLEFYEACVSHKQPWDVSVEQFGSRLDTDEQYYGLRYTHEVSSINAGVRCSAYKILPSMEDKLKGQMDLADKIRAVDASDVAKLVIEKHLIRDIRGNLRKFSMQEFRCSTCNEKFRRPPLVGKCLRCGGKIIFTISEGSIIKYLEPAISLADNYNLPSYVKQNLELTKRNVESLFGKEKEKQEGLGRWFG